MVFLRENFEQAVAALEHAKYALAFASGSATTATILQSLAAGSHVISVSDVYGGTHRYFTKVAKAHGVQVSFSPCIELDVEALIHPEDTKLVWIETPSNPTLGLVDIEKVAAVAHRHGILVVVDNTFMSPYVQNPLDHGADIVMHSVTKYINGHSVCLDWDLPHTESVLTEPGCLDGSGSLQLRRSERTSNIPPECDWCCPIFFRLLARPPWSQNPPPARA